MLEYTYLYTRNMYSILGYPTEHLYLRLIRLLIILASQGMYSIYLQYEIAPKVWHFLNLSVCSKGNFHMLVDNVVAATKILRCYRSVENSCRAIGELLRQPESRVTGLTRRTRAIIRPSLAALGAAGNRNTPSQK